MRAVCLIHAVILIGMLGCGGSERRGPETVPVSGTVTLNGKPLEGADVHFVRDDFSSFAKTGPDGTFTLVQGAVAGENQVSISKWEGEGPEYDPESGYDEGQLESEIDALGGDMSKVKSRRQLVPPDYRNLTYSVPEGGTDSANFSLTGG